MRIDESLVLFNLEVDSKEEVIQILGSQLYKKGYVTDGFVKGAIDREKQFPTGLPTSPYGIAIPHTDSDKVIKAQIAFANTKTPIKFRSMSNANEEVNVNIVFMLALNNPEDQLDMLQKLMAMFQNEETVKKLGEVRGFDEFCNVINV